MFLNIVASGFKDYHSEVRIGNVSQDDYNGLDFTIFVCVTNVLNSEKYRCSDSIKINQIDYNGDLKKTMAIHNELLVACEDKTKEIINYLEGLEQFNTIKKIYIEEDYEEEI